MRALVAIVLTVSALAGPGHAAARPADDVVRIHRSVGPVALGMTRGEAIAALGTPPTAGRRSLRYDGGRLRVGLDPAGRRVTRIAVDRRGVCTARAVCIGRPGGLTRLRRLYGPSLRLLRDEGHHLYMLPGRIAGRPVETVFDVPSGPGDRPLDIVVAIAVSVGSTVT